MIRKARLQKRLTQYKLSKLTGISQSYLSRLEQEYFFNSPTIRQVLALSDALNVDKVKLFLYFAEKELEYNVNK